LKGLEPLVTFQPNLLKKGSLFSLSAFFHVCLLSVTTTSSTTNLSQTPLADRAGGGDDERNGHGRGGGVVWERRGAWE
jgi:hypothetical protein